MTAEPRRGYPWRYGLPIALYYATLGMSQGYLVKYFQQAGIAADSAQMMWLVAATPMMALCCQPLWGRAADRLRWRNSALLVMGAVSTAVILLLPLSTRFAWMLAMNGLYAAFFTAFQPLSDSIVLEDLRARGAPFGYVRLMGSAGFAVTNLLLAGWLEGRFQVVPYVTAGLGLMLTLSALVLPRARGHQRGRLKVPLWHALRAPGMVPLLLMTVTLMLAMGYFYSYFTLHFTALPGGRAGLLGLGYFISAFSELPFLIFSDRLYRRFGTGRLMVFSAAFLTVRFTVMGLAGHAGWLLLSQVLHGGGFIVITVSMAKYINDTVPDELRAAGQMLLGVVAFGLARVFGTFAGAWVSRLSGGTSGGFRAMAALCLLAFLAGALYFFRRPALNGVTKKD